MTEQDKTDLVLSVDSAISGLGTVTNLRNVLSMENRTALRTRAVLKGEIRYHNGLMSTQCVVRDLSETGARLELPGDIPLADHFDLFIEKRNQTLPAVVKRKRGAEVGIAFVNNRETASDGLSERVAKLEAEVAAQRELLEKIQTRLEKTS